MEVVTRGLRGYTVTHICYGDVPKIYPAMLRLAVNQIDLALKNDDFALLETFKSPRFTKDIGLGVLDAHSHRAETPEEIVEGIRRTLDVIPVKQVYVSPDCGLKTRTTEETVAKLAAMVEGTRRVRKELSA
jgi:5-methyltetrahydropteroyltriglutamate--homocysteine methyltransferase